jgi:hypothetical protein
MTVNVKSKVAAVHTDPAMKAYGGYKALRNVSFGARCT